MVLTVVFDFGGNQSGALLVGIAAFVAIKVLINVLRVEIMLFFIMLMWFYVFLYVSMFGNKKLIKLKTLFYFRKCDSCKSSKIIQK